MIEHGGALEVRRSRMGGVRIVATIPTEGVAAQ